MTLRPLIFVATFAIAAPAFAQGHSTTGTTVQGSSEMQELVSFADLDLRERSAQRALNHRVIQASERLCIRSEGKFNVDKHFGGRENSCAARTYQHARSQIDNAIRIAESGHQKAGTLAIVLDQNASR